MYMEKERKQEKKKTLDMSYSVSILNYCIWDIWDGENAYGGKAPNAITVNHTFHIL